jgi:hypothetical protein
MESRIVAGLSVFTKSIIRSFGINAVIDQPRLVVCISTAGFFYGKATPDQFRHQ